MRTQRLPELLDFRFYMVHPAVIVAYYIGLLIMTFLFGNPLYILTVMFFSIAYALYYNGYAQSKGTFKVSLIIGAFMLVLNPLTSHKGAHILFYLFDNPITMEAVASGLINAVLFATMFIMFLSFNRLIDSERFLYIFSKLSPKAAFITNMTLRYIWLYKDRASELAQVQSIDINTENEGKAAKIKRSGKLLSALVSWSLEEGMKTSLVLKAKEYGRHGRSNYILYKFALPDGICLAVILAILSALVAAALCGAGQFSVYPDLSALKMDIYDWLVYGLLFLYLAIPLFMEGYTAIKRRILNGGCITAQLFHDIQSR